MVFCLWILTAASVTLAYYLKNSSASPEAVEDRLEYPMAWREMAGVFQFIYFEMRGDPLTIDERWEYERKITTIEQSRLSIGGSGAAMKDLQEMLGQMGFQLDVPDSTRLNQALTDLQEQRARVKTGALADYYGDMKYKIREAPYDLNIDGKIYTLILKPANAKLNLNMADDESLARYLQYLGIEKRRAEKLSKLLVDFRDSDSSVLGEGSEGPYRYGFDRLVPALNHRINRFDVLLYLPGMDMATLQLLRQNFVLFGDDRRMNYRYNAPEALAAYADLTLDEVARGIEYENNKSDPLYGQTLERLLGTQAAEKWENFVTGEFDQNDPAIIELKGPKLSLSGIYDVRNRTLLSVAPASL